MNKRSFVLGCKGVLLYNNIIYFKNAVTPKINKPQF
nr:MAG TPA: hypothetical protein [Caudoviricetes sp.]